MVRLLKYIMVVVLALIAFNWANDIPAKIEMDRNTSSIPYAFAEPQAFQSHKLPFLPEAELGSIGISAYHHAYSRTLRNDANSLPAALKDITRNISERQTLLTRHWRKLCDFSLQYSHPVGEYYVFALRQIII